MQPTTVLFARASQGDMIWFDRMSTIHTDIYRHHSGATYDNHAIACRGDMLLFLARCGSGEVGNLG